MIILLFDQAHVDDDYDGCGLFVATFISFVIPDENSALHSFFFRLSLSVCEVSSPRWTNPLSIKGGHDDGSNEESSPSYAVVS